MKKYLSDKDLELMHAELIEAAKAELRKYHRELIAKYGYLPRWAGPFHYCAGCRAAYPNLCDRH